MSRWPLLSLARLRSAQALDASRGAAVRWKEAVRAQDEAEEMAARAVEERRRACAAHGGSKASAAVELWRGASSRAAADRSGRRTALEGRRAASRAERAIDLAARATAAAGELRGRADALARGAGRWAEQGRRGREARWEREVEEAWNGARGSAAR